MKKAILRAASAMTLFVLLMPVAAHAAVDRAIVHGFGESGPGKIAIATHFMDGGSETLLYNIDMTLGTTTTEQNLLDRANAAVQAFATTQGYSLPNGIVWPYLSPNQLNSLIAAATSSMATVATSSNIALTLQTSTGAVGTQVSTTTGGYVMIGAQVSTTASIAGNAAGDIILEVAPTNSATAGDWVEWGRCGNSQTLSLAITLQSIQVTKCQVIAYVPQNWYVKARTLGSGTVSYTLNTAKKITQ